MIIAEVSERFVYKQLYEHEINSISPSQHGFLRNRSCTTQMSKVFHMIRENLDNNIQTDIIYLDFAKAFDPVDHGLILAKLKKYGISGRIFKWFLHLDLMQPPVCLKEVYSALYYLYYLSTIYRTSSLKIPKLPYMLMTQSLLDK